MAGRQPSGLIMRIFANIRKSLHVKPNEKGNLIGRDPFGNVYYEIPANPKYVDITDLKSDSATTRSPLC